MVRNLVPNLAEDFTGNADPAGGRKWLDAGGDVHRVAEYVGLALFDVAEVDTNTQLDGRYPRLRVPFVEMLLNIDSALDRLQRAVELRQEPIAHGFDLSSMVGAEERANECRLFVPESEGGRLAGLSRRCRADHVGEHNGGETAD